MQQNVPSAEKKFIKKFAKDIRDHCHYTGKYRAHSICNLRLNMPNEVPRVSQWLKLLLSICIKELAK